MKNFKEFLNENMYSKVIGITDLLSYLRSYGYKIDSKEITPNKVYKYWLVDGDFNKLQSEIVSDFEGFGHKVNISLDITTNKEIIEGENFEIQRQGGKQIFLQLRKYNIKKMKYGIEGEDETY